MDNKDILNNDNYSYTNKIDYGHRDWLLFTQEKLIQSVDKNISVKIINSPNNGKKLIASGISEESIEKLLLLVNTDQNNNYLYLEQFNVYVFGFQDPLNIPGLNDICLNLYRDADLDNFISGSKTKNPFTGENVSGNSGISVPTFASFIDLLTSVIPYAPKTSGKQKFFEIILNPDDPSGSAQFKTPK